MIQCTQEAKGTNMPLLIVELSIDRNNQILRPSGTSTCTAKLLRVLRVYGQTNYSAQYNTEKKKLDSLLAELDPEVLGIFRTLAVFLARLRPDEKQHDVARGVRQPAGSSETEREGAPRWNSD